MTDKTIINGVDVSGCEFYHHTVCDLHCEKYHDNSLSSLCCEHNPNCYFKQSARKDERIRELEEKLSQIGELTGKIENIYEVLKAIDFEKRSRFFIARTSSNTKYDLWEFRNFLFSFIQPIYEQHVKHLQQIKRIAQGE